jgi:hypothetical protein
MQKSTTCVGSVSFYSRPMAARHLPLESGGSGVAGKAGARYITQGISPLCSTLSQGLQGLPKAPVTPRNGPQTIRCIDEESCFPSICGSVAQPLRGRRQEASARCLPRKSSWVARRCVIPIGAEGLISAITLQTLPCKMMLITSTCGSERWYACDSIYSDAT